MGWLRHDLVVDRLAAVPAGSRVLEVGAGQGAMAVRLARRFRYTGIEADPTSAAVAQARLRDAGTAHEFHVGSFSDVAPEPGFNALCAFEVLEHIPDDVGALSAWRELLAPGGILVLSVPAWQERYGPTDARVGHIRRYDPEALTDALKRAGFIGIDVKLYGFPLGYALEAGRDLLTRHRPPPAARQGTAESGRFMQPTSPRSGIAIDVLTRPFRALQRLVHSTRLGTGIVASARRP